MQARQRSREVSAFEAWSGCGSSRRGGVALNDGCWPVQVIALQAAAAPQWIGTRPPTQPDNAPSNSTVTGSVPVKVTWQARRDLLLMPTSVSSLAFSAGVGRVRPLRPSVTKTWQPPHLASPPHWLTSWPPASMMACSYEVPAATSRVRPAGWRVSVLTEGSLSKWGEVGEESETDQAAASAGNVESTNTDATCCSGSAMRVMPCSARKRASMRVGSSGSTA